MKKGWHRKTLGELCEIRNGSTPSKSNPAYWDGGSIPWFTIDDIRTQGRFILTTRKTITQAALEETSVKLLPADSVLLCCTASVGEWAIARIPVTTNQQFNGLIVRDRSELSPDFLFHYAATLKDELLRLSGKTTIDFIPISRVRDVTVPLPPLPEQRRIVGTLDEAFEGIATAKANAEKNLQNARALFESRLQSVFTQRGEGWKQKTLEEIATTFGRGKSKHRPRNAPHLYGGKYPFVQTGDIRNADHIITEYSQTYSEAGLAQSKLWPNGTICITIAANIAETAILGFDACFPDSVIGVVANPKEADIGFIEYLLQSFKTRLQAMGKGSAQANINMGTFENERFPFPPVAEQKDIVSKLDALTEETQRLASLYECKLAALDELKKSLLHRAFSGELTQ